jgi:hypothetical protein
MEKPSWNQLRVLYRFILHSRCPTESRKSHVIVAPDIEPNTTNNDSVVSGNIEMVLKVKEYIINLILQV